MSVAPTADGRQEGRYVLRFHTKRVEADYEGTFLAKGSSLDACCARGALDVSLTHSTHATHEQQQQPRQAAPKTGDAMTHAA